MILLNGVPVSWRSNKQPDTSISPAEAEIYALSEGMRDARHVSWIAEEMGMTVQWPLKVYTDSMQSKSFCDDYGVPSKLRGCFDRRDKWVLEMKNRQEKGCVAEWVRGIDNKSDLLTKCFKPGDFNTLTPAKTL